MKRSELLFTCAISIVLSLVVSASADVRIKLKRSMNMPGMPGPINTPSGVRDPSQLPDTMVYIKGPRLRSEVRAERPTMTGMKTVVFTSLQQCDLGRLISFTSDKKRYRVTYFNNASGGARDTRRERRGTVDLSVTYTDTGERQVMFGLTARRVKSLMTMTPDPAACNKTSMKIETDAWYIDLQGFSCPGLPAESTLTGEDGGCNDQINYRINGKPEYGFAVKETKVLTAAGQPPITIKSEVVEFSPTQLDAALFDVPAGYEEDKSSASVGARQRQRHAQPWLADQRRFDQRRANDVSAFFRFSECANPQSNVERYAVVSQTARRHTHKGCYAEGADA